jgi:RimJ/RimL family protein N-acetyltransferase
VRYGLSRDQWWRSAEVYLETPRLLLCNWKEQDRHALRPLTEDPEVLRYINHGVPWTETESRAWLDRQRWQRETLGYCYWKLLDRKTHRLVGFCGVQPLENSPETEIGWRLARDCWGRGLASEAAGAAMDDAFRRGGLRRLVALVMEPNLASRRVTEKLGMIYERAVVEFGMDFLLYSIDREKWMAPGVGLSPYGGMDRKPIDS